MFTSNRPPLQFFFIRFPGQLTRMLLLFLAHVITSCMPSSPKESISPSSYLMLMLLYLYYSSTIVGVASGKNRERSRGRGAASSSSSSNNRSINFIHTERILAVKEEGEEEDKGGKTNQSKETHSLMTVQATPNAAGGDVSNKVPVVVATGKSADVPYEDKKEEQDKEEVEYECIEVIKIRGRIERHLFSHTKLICCFWATYPH